MQPDLDPVQQAGLAGLAAVRKQAPTRQRPFGGLALQPEAVAELEHEALLHLFIDARHTHEIGRRDLPDIRHDGVDRLGEVHDAAQHQLGHHGVATLRHMAERQIGDVLEVVPDEAGGLGVLIGRVDQIAVGQHGALRRPCCT